MVLSYRRRRALRVILLAHQQRRRSIRRFYIRPLNRSRITNGEFHNLVRDMRVMDEETFYRTFRMTPTRFDDLLSRIRHLITHKPTHSMPIGAEQRLAVTLKFLASKSDQQTIAIGYRMGKSTLNGIIYEVCESLWTILQPEFLPHPTPEMFRDISIDFWNIWNFPLCLGAIDGKHVVIQMPKNSGTEYFNYKKTFSVILMACCDARYQFTMVDIGGSGRQGDAGTFGASQFGNAILTETLNVPQAKALPGSEVMCPHVFVADEAFQLRTNVMRPYSGAQLPDHDERCVFNYRLSRARRVIENTFGILAARWRVLLAPIEAKPANVDMMVKATVVLHNYLRATDAANPPTCRYIPADFVDYEDQDGNVVPGQWRNFVPGRAPERVMDNPHAQTLASKEVRNRFTEYFLTNAGEVPWQYRAALSRDTFNT